MIYVWIILAALAYIAVGAFICGIMDEEDYILWFISFWPIIGLVIILVMITKLPFDLGYKINEWWYNRD